MGKNQLVVSSDQRGRTTLTNLRNAAFVGGVTALTALASVGAHADGDTIDTSGLNTQISTAKATILILFSAGLVVLGIFAGYRYLKRGANSA